MRESEMIYCAVIRGGTSKGVFFRENDLPKDLKVREKVILAAFGSPDVRQIDGLGGANSQTSKMAIVGPSSREDADVDYTFGQVSITEPLVDWRGNCGNLSSAVGPFAINHGMVNAVEPVTTVRIFNTNTKKHIIAEVPVKDGKAATKGEYSIPGVPGTGARISLEFVDPAGSVTGKLLPTDNPRDTVTLDDGRRFTVSIVDAGNPAVLMLASELGLEGGELPPQVEKMSQVMETIEKVRGAAAELMGIVKDRKLATKISPAVPKAGFVAAPKQYTTTTGAVVKRDEIDILARLASMQTMHRSYMITGGVFTGAAAMIEGTIVQELSGKRAVKGKPTKVLIGHPYGVMDVEVRIDKKNRKTVIEGVRIGRTARTIMEGWAYIPAERFAH